MWMEGLVPHEQRRTMRVRSKGSIRIGRGRHVVRGRVVDIAIGGVGMSVDLASDRLDLVGKRVGVELRLDASAGATFALHGHVRRSSARTLAIELDDVPAAFEDCVQDELLSALEFDQSPHVVLVDIASAQRGAIASAFRRGGCSVTEVATPLEAIARLDRTRFEPGVIAIADTWPESVAEELREFLSAQHPRAHRVAIGKSRGGRDPAGSWLSTANPNDDLDVRVGRVLTAHAVRHQPRCGSDPTHRR
jgi:CheY-like chemotaxis protein